MLPIQLLKYLNSVNQNAIAFSDIRKLNIIGQASSFGQVSPGFCGVDIVDGDCANKTVSTLATELSLFINTSSFYKESNAFCLAVVKDISDKSYEWLFYPLTDVYIENDKLWLSSNGEELKDLRKLYTNEDYESGN